MTVADVIGQTTDTGNVGRLSRAIMARMNVLVPGLMIPIASPRVVAAPRVHQVLQSAARAALMQVLAAHPDHPMALASCYRTLPQQVCLWAWYLASSSGGTERARRERAWALKLCTKEHAEKAEVPLAAPPGASSHEDAAAVDCQNSAFWRSAFLVHGWHWQGAQDPSHYSFRGRGFRDDIGSIGVRAFQVLHNEHNPEAAIAADGVLGPATLEAILDAPAGGW